MTQAPGSTIGSGYRTRYVQGLKPPPPQTKSPSYVTALDWHILRFHDSRAGKLYRGQYITELSVYFLSEVGNEFCCLETEHIYSNMLSKDATRSPFHGLESETSEIKSTIIWPLRCSQCLTTKLKNATVVVLKRVTLRKEKRWKPYVAYYWKNWNCNMGELKQNDTKQNIKISKNRTTKSQSMDRRSFEN